MAEAPASPAVLPDMPLSDAPLTDTPVSDAPALSVEGFEGPLDFLLEMVRRHRVDLGRLSIVTLTDQFIAALENSAGRVPLERRSAWVVMASDLVLLRSQLLTPASLAEAAQAEQEAARRLEMLGELARMRAAAAWLAARPQLRHETHGRGEARRAARPQPELLLAFLEATLVLLEGRPANIVEGEAGAPARLAALELWRMPEALERLRALLAGRPAPLPLAEALPAARRGGRLRRRSAWASTFLAGLELERLGEATLSQAAPFSAIALQAAPAEQAAA